MYRSIRNSHIDPLPCPGRGEYDRPQRTWGGAFDHNTRWVGNLIRCLDFMFHAAFRIKAARVCLQMLKHLPDPSVIIGEVWGLGGGERFKLIGTLLLVVITTFYALQRVMNVHMKIAQGLR